MRTLSRSAHSHSSRKEDELRSRFSSAALEADTEDMHRGEPRRLNMRYSFAGSDGGPFDWLRKATHFCTPTQGSIPTHGLPVRLLLIAGLLCALLVAGLGDGKRAQAAALSVGNDPMKMAVDLAKPAVVRI